MNVCLQIIKSYLGGQSLAVSVTGVLSVVPGFSLLAKFPPQISPIYFRETSAQNKGPDLTRGGRWHLPSSQFFPFGLDFREKDLALALPRVAELGTSVFQLTTANTLAS